MSLLKLNLSIIDGHSYHNIIFIIKAPLAPYCNRLVAIGAYFCLILVIQTLSESFWDGLGPSFVQNWGTLAWGLVTPQKFAKFVFVKIPAFSALVDGDIFLTLYCGNLWALRLISRKIHIVQNFKLCISEAINSI